MDIKEEFSREMLEIIRSSKAGIINGIDIASVQIPEVIDQILRYHFIKAIFLAMFSLVVCIAIALIWRVCKNFYNKQSYDYSFFCFLSFLAGMFVVVPLLGLCVMQTLKILQIAIAPKLFLLEYLTSVVSSKTL